MGLFKNKEKEIELNQIPKSGPETMFPPVINREVHIPQLTNTLVDKTEEKQEGVKQNG